MAPREPRTGDLARLLARRVAATGQPLDGEVSVAELHRRLVPYEVARADLALATKAEYDLALLDLLAGDQHLQVEDEELARAVRSELDAPEPGVAFLQDFAASHVTLRLEQPEGEEARESDELDAVFRAFEEGRAEDAATPDACPSCGEGIPEAAGEARFCVWCGADLSVRPCGECGAELRVEWSYCPHCGGEAVS